MVFIHLCFCLTLLCFPESIDDVKERALPSWVQEELTRSVPGQAEGLEPLAVSFLGELGPEGSTKLALGRNRPRVGGLLPYPHETQGLVQQLWCACTARERKASGLSLGRKLFLTQPFFNF